MPDLIFTPGAANANSFVSLEEFETYLDSRLNTASLLTSREEDDRVRALLEASRDITRLPFVGTRATIAQRLSWPRSFAMNPDLPNLSLVTDIALLYFDNTIVPDRVKNAVYEYSIALLNAGSTDLTLLDPNASIAEKTVGPLRTVFTSPSVRPSGLARFPRVIEELAPLLDASSSSGGLSVVRV